MRREHVMKRCDVAAAPRVAHSADTTKSPGVSAGGK
jgi:hypothetical protein